MDQVLLPQTTFTKTEAETAVPDSENCLIKKPHPKKLGCFRDLADKQLSRHLLHSKLMVEKVCAHSQFQQEISLTIEDTSINKEVVVLRARWGYFSMDITILNVNGENNRHGPKIGEGAFGVAYKATANDRQFILKCIPIRETKSRSHAIKEWFILKIASLAEFGPKLEPHLGFDMLMYSNCVEFPMEVCSSIFSVSSNLRLLEESLALMHRLRLVHMDIKPQNIMLSPGHRKPVFIDFGLSRFVGQELGEKSLTRFYGSINFCSADMNKCFSWRNRSKEDWVDLYHNDLVSLEGSIQYIKSSASLYGFSQAEQYQAASLKELPNFIEFQLKYLLFKRQTDCFLQTWLQYIHKAPSQQSYCRNFFLHFLLELLPTDELKRLFYALCADSDNQSRLYSKVKLVYEMNRDNLYSLRQLQEEEKLACFSAYCDQYLLGDESNQSLQSRKASVAEMVLKPAAIRKVPFTEYALAYLEYMSYLQNRHRVSSAEREAAATVYAELFCPTDLKGRNLVLFTIKHLFEWALQAQDLSQDYDTSAIILLRIYDFFTILGLSSCHEMLRIVSRIYESPRLSMLHRYLFVLRVKSSCSLYEYRLLGSADSSIVDMVTDLMRWGYDKKKEIDGLIPYKKLLKMSSYVSQENNLMELNLSDDFIKEFGLQTMEYLMIDCYRYQYSYAGKLIELANRLNLRSNYRRFCYFYSELFRIQFFAGSSYSICFNIFKIFKENVQDDSILQEFVFGFVVIKARFIKFGTIQQIIPLLNSIDSQLLRINDDDLILLSNHIQLIFNSLKVASTKQLNSAASIASFLNNQNSFIVRYVKSAASYYRRQLMSIGAWHKCLDATSILNVLTVAKSITNPQASPLLNFLTDKAQVSKIGCSRCREIVDLNISLIRLQSYLSQYIHYKEIGQDRRATEILTRLTEESKSMQEHPFRIQQRNRSIWLSVTINALKFAKLICCSNPAEEKEFHGIENYYRFAKKNDMIDSYFCNQEQNCFPIYFTMAHLWETDQDETIQFLHRLTRQLELSLRAKDYYVFFIIASQFIGKFTQPELVRIFQKFKAYEKKKTVSSYLAIMYIILLNYSASSSLINAIAKNIFTKIHKMHHRFQRHIFVHISIKVCKQLAQKQEWRSQKQWQYCNNRLVKLLTIQESTKINAMVQSPKLTNQKKAFLKAKIAKIGYFQGAQSLYKFTVIKKSRLNRPRITS